MEMKEVITDGTEQLFNNFLANDIYIINNNNQVIIYNNPTTSRTATDMANNEPIIL